MLFRHLRIARKLENLLSTKKLPSNLWKKILWQQKRNFLHNIWMVNRMLIYRGSFHRKSRIHRLCSQKFIPKRTRFELQFLCCGGHFSKQMNAFSRLPSCSSKGRRKMNLKSTTTNGFNFRIINSLMESWQVRLTRLENRISSRFQSATLTSLIM